MNQTWRASITITAVSLLWAILVIHIFQAGTLTMADAVIGVITTLISLFLIYSTNLEKRHKKLEQTATGLKELTETLEGRVAEQTEEAVRARAHADTILESLTLGIIEYQGDQTIVRVNRAAEEILGVKRDAVVGKKFLPMDMRAPELSSLAAITFFSSSGAALKQDVNNLYGALTDEIAIEFPIHRDLQVITVLVQTTDGRSSEYNIIKLLRDITREKLVDKSKSNFITVAAHQLRTPLSAIRWALNLVLGDRGNLSPDQINILESGAKATNQVITLINDLLDVSQIEDGRMGYKLTPGDLAETIRATIALLGLKAQEKGVTLSVVIPPDVHTLPFDKKKISIVIQNLISNAINYTPGGGKVNVALEYGPRYATLTVADTGVGIPSEELSRVFTKFFRSKQALQMETSGSGLGLFIVKNIIERHGGTITLDSKEGEGTIVSFTLPLSHEDTPKN
ncbi:MAG: sensor histidine kinase [Minisyncoccota bacterium]